MKINSLIVLSVGLAMATGLSGCKQPASQSITMDHTGSYTLDTINGKKLPCTPPHHGGAPEVRSSLFLLRPDGTFTNSMTYGTPSGREMHRGFTGTYTRQGSVLKFKWKGAGMTTAEFAGDTLAMNNEGTIFTYRK